MRMMWGPLSSLLWIRWQLWVSPCNQQFYFYAYTSPDHTPSFPSCTKTKYLWLDLNVRFFQCCCLGDRAGFTRVSLASRRKSRDHWSVRGGTLQYWLAAESQVREERELGVPFLDLHSWLYTLFQRSKFSCVETQVHRGGVQNPHPLQPEKVCREIVCRWWCIACLCLFPADLQLCLRVEIQAS